MLRTARMSALALAAMAGTMVLSTTGCASLEKQRQLEMSNRSLAEEKQQAERELYDARNLVDNLRGKVRSLEGELGTKDRLVQNLQNENNRLESAFGTCQSTLEAMAGKPPIAPAVLTQTILPKALDSALKRFASEHGDVVEYNEALGTVKWKSDLLFALGSDVVRESAMSALSAFADIMSSPVAGDFDIIVVGHTDNVPINREATKRMHPTNWHLSAHRAIAVRDALESDGVPAGRTGVMGFGELRPVVSNDSEDSRARTRRVEIHIVPRGTIGMTTHASGNDSTMIME